jgi:cytoskeleton protein RodZ
MKLSTADVAQRLRMNVKQIEALEAQRWQEFPSPAILRGFLRSYAKLLNLNVEPLMSACSPANPESVGLGYASTVSVPLPGRRLNQKIINRAFFLSFIAVALVAFIFALWTHWRNIAQWSQARITSTQASAKTVEVPVALPVPQNPLPPSGASTPTAPLAVEQNFSSLSLTFSGDSWVEILEGDNTVLARGLQAAGTELNLQGKSPPYRLLIGNAKEVVLKYQGNKIDLSPYIGDKVARLRLE